MIVHGIQWKNGLFKQQTLKQPKLAQLEKVLYKWFTAMYSKGKPVTAYMLIEKAKWQLSILQGFAAKFW
jgi:hypothetical protein